MGENRGAIIPSILEVPSHKVPAGDVNKTDSKPAGVDFFLNVGENIDCIPSPCADPSQCGALSVEGSIKSNWEHSISTQSKF